jgi:hypothetical protein
MEKTDMALRLSHRAAEGIRAYFADTRSPLDLSEFLDAYLVAFWEFLLERGYTDRMEQLREETDAENIRSLEHRYNVIYHEAMEDWKRNANAGDLKFLRPERDLLCGAIGTTCHKSGGLAAE